MPEAPDGPLHVLATAGHVDHGKSALILRLTGMDPDRWEEEKRRGLTLDLGFAWGSLPSGREVGFVDVPGHERFVRNMLAGVGPVRLILFVVAADEGWKPQSEEHLAIVDVLGAEGAVVALTKRDLVDEPALAARAREVRERLAGTALETARVVACSSVTGEGLDELLAALDEMVETAPPPAQDRRPRISLDRSFTIRGAGTVVTGTLTGGAISVGDDVQIHPDGLRARVRSLQTHRRAVTTARPVARVAVNLAGLPKKEVARGDVLTHPGRWRPADVLEARIRPVRGLERPLGGRGAYKLYLGAAERDARLRLYGTSAIRPGGAAFVRIRLSRGVVAEVGDRFVLREAGRRQTVAGGVVLDVDPPRRPGPTPEERLARRAAAGADLPSLLVAERGAVPAADLLPLAGRAPASVAGAERLGRWWVADEELGRLTEAVRAGLEAFHREHPLRAGVDWAEVRPALEEAAPHLIPALERDLETAVLRYLERSGVVARKGTRVSLASHRVSLGAMEDDARRLVAEVAEGEPTPPDVRRLVEGGFSGELIEAVAGAGRLVAVGPDLVFTPAFVAKAEAVARREAAEAEGLTVGRFRELLGTTRKYALPLLERFDAERITRRDGDVRRLRGR